MALISPTAHWYWNAVHPSFYCCGRLKAYPVTCLISGYLTCLINCNWKRCVCVTLSLRHWEAIECRQSCKCVSHSSISASILQRQVAISRTCQWFLTPQLPHSLPCLFFSIVCFNYRGLCYGSIHCRELYEKYCSRVWRKLLASPEY